MGTFPELSRKPALKTRTTTMDPTLRDPMENGAEATRLRYPRGRRQLQVNITALTQDDVADLDEFVRDITEEGAAYGANAFLFTDVRDPQNPVTLTVRFSTLPDYTDIDGTDQGVRQNCVFTLREV